MRSVSTDHLLKKKIDVDEIDVTATYRRGRANRPNSIDISKDNVYILTFPGAGGVELGQALAEALGCLFVDVTDKPGQEALETAVSKPGQVVALPPGAAQEQDACRRLQSSGKVFYLLIETPDKLLDRLGLTGREREQKRQELGRDIAAYDSLCMACAHQFFRADAATSQLTQSACEFLGHEL